ncbi:TerB family tellurite resistance protein [Azoarcus sp. L1K30]|uniref:TerB family tellurite resistance protein n=1 Tax=Azoarcus sp. L1K30 TaxID=2820277 RepID=UPI001B8335C1|nr:TerB family tellurite resistance protein [Azoarcus sp. L1K30]MBR0567049.1 TerB family tellurite resistance protein [Azoarcus sp. L1K30]
MRQYATNSAQAAARILALTILADGGLDRTELESLSRSEAVERLKIDEHAFEGVLQAYCQDLLQGAEYLDGIALRLAPDVLRLLLEEIQDPAFQTLILKAMDDIVHADGVRTEEEAALLSHAAAVWTNAQASSRLQERRSG